MFIFVLSVVYSCGGFCLHRKDDLFIGSPYFAKEYDEGRVHVYMSKKGNGYVSTKILFI